MPRSQKEERSKRKYASVREAAQKMSMGFQASYLDLPKGAVMWKPKAGKFLIDIMPYIAGTKNPRAEKGMMWWEYTFYVHRGMGANSETYICPARTSNKPCPICEYREKLVRKGDEDDEKLIKSLATKQRQLINLIDLKDPEKGVQLYEVANFNFGDQLIQDVAGSDEDEGWDLFFSLDEGCTLRVSMVEDSFGGRSFVKAGRFDFKPRKEGYEDSILDDVYDLEGIIKELPYDKLKAKFLSTSAKDEDADEEDEDEDEDADEVDEDEEEETPKSKKKVAGKSKSKEEDEDEEDEDEDTDADEDEEEEEETPKKKKKKPAADEEDEDEEEEDADADEEDEEDEAPKSKKKKGKEEEEDDDADWDDFDDEEEEEETPKKKKKVVK